MPRGMCDRCESPMGTHKKSTEQDPAVISEIAFAGEIRLTPKQGIQPTTARGACQQGAASTTRSIEKLSTSNSSNARRILFDSGADEHCRMLCLANAMKSPELLCDGWPSMVFKVREDDEDDEKNGDDQWTSRGTLSGAMDHEVRRLMSIGALKSKPSSGWSLPTIKVPKRNRTVRFVSNGYAK